MKNKAIRIRVEEDLLEQLRRISTDKDLPYSWIVRQSIRKYIKEVDKL